MNNKPVAWTTKKPKTVQDFSFYQTQIYTEPLYTTPQTKPLSKPEECKDGCPELQVCDYCQQTKPLSDEEIMKLLNGIEYSQAEVETSFDYEIRIARAIEERHGIK